MLSGDFVESWSRGLWGLAISVVRSFGARLGYFVNRDRGVTFEGDCCSGGSIGRVVDGGRGHARHGREYVMYGFDAGVFPTEQVSCRTGCRRRRTRRHFFRQGT